MIGQSAMEVRLLLGRAARISTLVTLIGAISLMVVGPYLIRLFYGDAFQSTVKIFWILSVDSVLSGLAALLAQIFYALGKPELMIWRRISGLAVTLLGMLLLGGTYGIAGIAIAVLLTSIFMVILTLAMFPLTLKIPMPRLWAPIEDLSYISHLWTIAQKRIQYKRNNSH